LAATACPCSIRAPERADHEDIDDVMLATTLVPEGVLVLPTVR
jgi:hypothetical protein